MTKLQSLLLADAMTGIVSRRGGFVRGAQPHHRHEEAMKIYIAASFARIEEARELAHELKKYGIQITSKWLSDEPGKYDMSPQKAARDLEDVLAGEAVVMLTGDKLTRGGRHFEAGYAHGRGLRVICYGPPEMIFHTLMKSVRSVEELLNLLGYVHPELVCDSCKTHAVFDNHVARCLNCGATRELLCTVQRLDGTPLVFSLEPATDENRTSPWLLRAELRPGQLVRWYLKPSLLEAIKEAGRFNMIADGNPASVVTYPQFAIVEKELRLYELAR